MADTARVFDAMADDYEGQRRRLVPSYDDFYGALVDALELCGRPLSRVLDLGAGTGLVARMVAAAHPEARLTLLDAAPAMLAQARQHPALAAAEQVVGDLRDAPPPGPWDAVVSALAIHHLEDRAKAELFARVHHELAPGGVFVNAEQVAGPTALFDDAYAAWHARRAHALGATEDEWAGSKRRMLEDRLSGVDRQLGWLRDAGFTDADCLFKNRGFAVLVARRAG